MCVIIILVIIKRTSRAPHLVWARSASQQHCVQQNKNNGDNKAREGSRQQYSSQQHWSKTTKMGEGREGGPEDIAKQGYSTCNRQTCRQTQQSTTFFHGKRAVKFNTGGLSHSLKSYSGICLKPDYSRTPLKRNWPSQLFYPVSGRDCFKPIIWRSMFWDGLLLSHPTRKRVFLLVLYMWCVLTWPMPFIWHALQNFFWLILKK